MSKSVGPQAATIARPGTSTVSATILAASASRNGFRIHNDSAVVLYVLFGTGTASATNFTVSLAAGAAYEQAAGSATFGGAIQAITASSTGSAQVTTW